MITYIKTAHEESYSNNRTIGVLLNYNNDGERINSFPYLFRITGDDNNGMYVFFDTIVDLNDYLLYGDKKTKRSYMKEKDFDDLYDNHVDGIFENKLKWIIP